MLRILVRLAVVLAGLLALTVGQTTPAGAADASGCRIAPGYTFTFSPFCRNDRPATSYSVAFHVDAPAGTAFSWSVTGDWTSVITGCGAADAYCTVRTGGSNADRQVFASVSANGTAYRFQAYINWYCGSQLC